ncbi:hypothetical protein HOY80DRAFT_1052727 [Tuber brumale]|nr:hypothetical protein HOY80DRAFT_1052727 [Tuber brumale]
MLKLLRCKPGGLRHYDRILIGYYLDGLTSQPLQELIITSFHKRDTQETQVQVIRGMINYASRQSGQDDEDVDGRDLDVDANYSGNSSSDKEDDTDDGMENERAYSDDEKVCRDVQELREMMTDLMQLKKASITTGTGAFARFTLEDVIPLVTP